MSPEQLGKVATVIHASNGVQSYWAGLLKTCGYGASLTASADEQRLNIRLNTMDDLTDRVGCLGENPQSITPNLDRWAANGVLFCHAYCPMLAGMRKPGPIGFAWKVSLSPESPALLAWQHASDGDAPVSSSDGTDLKVVFIHTHCRSIEPLRIDGQGETKCFGLVADGKYRKQSSRAGAVWMVIDTESGETSGQLYVHDGRATAITTKKSNSNSENYARYKCI